EGATQCGFCTPGFVMSMAGYCLSERPATEKNAIACIDGNTCSCTGYKSIERAVLKLNDLLKTKSDAVSFVTKNKILPDYFSSIETRLKKLNASVADVDSKNKSLKQKQIISGGTDLYVQKHDEMVYADV